MSIKYGNVYEILTSSGHVMDVSELLVQLFVPETPSSFLSQCPTSQVTGAGGLLAKPWAQLAVGIGPGDS